MIMTPHLILDNFFSFQVEPNFITLNIEKVVANESRLRDFLAIYYVTNADFTYTGKYECYYTDSPELKSSVYIYVKG